MSLEIIKANPTVQLQIPKDTDDYLNIAEFFCDTIQGENFVGYPAAFLRLQHCTMACSWCDTSSVWHYGNPYTFEKLFDLMDTADLPRKLHDGQHLVLTGGSPLRQQGSLIRFINQFKGEYGFKPYIEIENECTLMPSPKISMLVDLWNNSPKLANSGNPDIIRYQPPILKHLSELPNSWFKFVVTGRESEWKEIEEFFLHPGLIRRDQVVLMPLGAVRNELMHYRERVVDLAIKENVRYTTREHVIIWDRATGV